MSNQEIIDDFINRQRGIPNASQFSIFGEEFSVEYFEKRARELGWINGYKWGVEYATNGKKPDLPDGVRVQRKFTDCWSNCTFPHSTYKDWGEVTAFRIVDERYKPKAKQLSISWQNLGELPPVGSFVDVVGEVQYGAKETNCEVIAHVENCAVIRMTWGLGCFESRVLRPAKSEREKFIDSAIKVVTPEGDKMISTNTASNWFGKLYDAGFRAPK